MSAVKFIIQREFPDTSGGMVPLEKEPARILVTEHETLLATAAETARSQGFAQGKETADTQETARLARAMESVSMALEEVRRDLDHIQTMASEEAIRFASDFALKLAGRLMDEKPLAIIQEVARQIFEDLRGQAHVAIRVAPQLIDATKEKLGAIARERGFEGRLIVMGEPEIPPGDVRIEWADGGIVRDRAQLEASVLAGVDRALATAERA
jgi:flagellar assembly protein FliH